MKNSFLFLFLLSCAVLLSAQNKNTSLLGSKAYTSPSLHGDVNDVWGYVDSLNKEYAIVGLQKGISIVDVTNPSSLNEVFYFAGVSSIWRDIKIWDKHAYITNETSGGLMIVDLSVLPGQIQASDVSYYTGSNYSFTQAHNLYIDENGAAYLFGSDYGNGGAIILDLSVNPKMPVELGVFDSLYLHDGMTRGDTLWGSAVNNGVFVAVDVSSKSNPTIMASQTTNGYFTHNCWISDDGDFLYTTDEISGGYIGAYDVSNFSNIKLVDLIRSSPDSGVIPHNVHVYGDFLVTSYYRDGVTIVDARYPDNLVQIGDYDTSPLTGGGFNGNWGAYPWLPSGNLLLTDIESGLFVIGVDYQPGVFLQGNTKKYSDSSNVGNVRLINLTNSDTIFSNLNGFYKSAYADSGLYRFAVSTVGYLPDTISVVLKNGLLRTEDIYLKSEIPFTITGKVNGIYTWMNDSAEVYLHSKYHSYRIYTDQVGNFQVDSVYEGFYEVTAGRWGSWEDCKYFSIQNSDHLVLELNNVSEADNFTLDLGWSVVNNGSNGFWERQEFDSNKVDFTLNYPTDDVDNDCSVYAFVSGAANSSDHDVDGGWNILYSPSFSGQSANDNSIIISYWFKNTAPSGSEDSLIFNLIAGQDTIRLLEVHNQNTALSSTWIKRIIDLYDIDLTNKSCQLMVMVGDFGADHLLEVGIDAFRFHSSVGPGIDEVDKSSLLLYPNPVNDLLTLESMNRSGIDYYEVISIHGKLMLSGELVEDEMQINTASLQEGLYILRLKTNAGYLCQRFVKSGL